ncbi:centrosomal protein of 89 kDa isoform X2 [Myripristis murdjan]|nr:centrosomal protein of 89 kDa isoform X2 [Myripristis murdjan]
MFKFSFRRDKDKEFRHIAHGLVPAASIAPKPAVPRTPPPRSPDPSPERPRSALAAAILSSSLTGQTFAVPPVRVRSFSDSDQSQSFTSELNINRDRWSEDLASQPHLFSTDQSEEELQDKDEEEVEDNEEEEGEEHVYQTLDRRQECTIIEPIYALPLKPKTSPPLLNQTSPSDRRMPSPDFKEEARLRSPKARHGSSKKKESRQNTGSWTEDVSASVHPSPGPCHAVRTAGLGAHKEVQKEVKKEVVRALMEHKAGLAEERRLLEDRLQRLEQELSHDQASSSRRHSADVQAETQTQRQQMQKLVDENDALKLTVHRLNVELSRYQAKFRPLSKQESSRINSLPMTGPPPPWLLDMKYLSPLLLAYEDRMNEKDALLQAVEEEMKKLRFRVEEVVKENERLNDEIAKSGGVSPKDCHQLQQQAILVLQENQVLIDQLEVQHVKAKASYNRHHSEVSKVSKKLMLLEEEKQHLQEELEEIRREAQVNQRELQEKIKEVQGLQARLKDAVTWDEHNSIISKLRWQLEQEEARKRSEVEELLLKVSTLQKENKSLALQKTNLTVDIERMEADLELGRQANRKTERRMTVLKRQKEEYVLKEVKARHYLGAVMSVAEQISKERDQLIHMASVLQQDKQKFIGTILEGTVRFRKLQEDVKVYRRQASARLAALQEAAEGKTASHRREVLHLQRLLGERQEAEERLLQYKREVEEELEVVWQAATRENRQMRETLLDCTLIGELRGQAVLCRAATGSSQALDEMTSSVQPRPNSPGFPIQNLSTAPGLQRSSIFESDLSYHQNNSLDERRKHGLDFYC